MNRFVFFSLVAFLFISITPVTAQQAEPTEQEQEMIKQHIAGQKQQLIKHYVKAAQELDQYGNRFYDSFRHCVSLSAQLTVLNLVLKLAMKNNSETIVGMLTAGWDGKLLLGLNALLVLREFIAMAGSRAAMGQLQDGMQTIATQINQLDSYLQFSSKNSAPKNNVMAA